MLGVAVAVWVGVEVGIRVLVGIGIGVAVARDISVGRRFFETPAEAGITWESVARRADVGSRTTTTGVMGS
jgi:hypothetical protein